MRERKILQRVIAFALVGVLLCTPTNFVEASNGSSTVVTSSDSNVSTGGGSGSGGSGWTYYNDNAYKMTTYILATTDLDYINSLPNDLKKYIICSREGMKQVKSNMGSTSISTFMEKYTNSVSYFGKGSQTYIADYYQQLGNGMTIEVENGSGRNPGYVGVVTSPQSHLSRFEDDGYKKSSGITDDMVSKYRSEIKIAPAKQSTISKEGSKDHVYLGNYCNLTNSEWLTVQGFNSPSSVAGVRSVAGSKGFLQYAIVNSMSCGLYYTGVSCSNLSKFGISVSKESGGRVTGKTIKVTEIVLDDSRYAFSMDERSYSKTISVKGYYNSGSSKVNVRFSCTQENLFNAFLYRYQIDGEHYTWKDLCLTSNDSVHNYGLNVSVVVIIEPVKMNYWKGSISNSDKKLYYGDYSPSPEGGNGLFLTLRERAYWLSGKRSTGLTGLKQKKAWSNSGSEIVIDEKYSAGLCLNYVTGEGLSESTRLVTRLNSMMQSGSSYAEFPKVKTGPGSRCKNNRDFMYGSDYDSINASASAMAGTNSNNLTGGIACIGYYHEMDLDSTSSINPFPSLTVRHIDNTALNNSDSNENVLMRDSITWTVPSSIGLAIESDVAKASFLTENQGLLTAYGGSETSLRYASVDSYLDRVLKVNKIVRNRFGTSDVEFSSKIELLKKAINAEEYNYNGISIKSMTFTQLLKGAYSKSNLSKTAFMQTVKKADKGDTQCRSDYYSWCLDAIVDHYSDYSVRIPLLRNDDSNLSTKITSGNTYWGISAKPLTSCSGNYEYYDGAIESADQTQQRKSLKKSIELLNKSKLSDWDSISARDNETGSQDENVLGETTNFVNSKLKFPGSRATSVLDYHAEDGVVLSSVCNNSKKGKLNFFYGKDFVIDRTVGSFTKYTKASLSSTTMRNGSIDTGDDVKKAYLPTAKVTKSYADVMYDVSIFNNSMGFMQKNSGQSVTDLVTSARQIRVSNLGGKASWPYLIFPEYSLGSRMLMGNGCTNKLVDVNTYAGLNSGSSDISQKGERKTREALMTYWNSTSYETHKSSGNVNIRDNMFSGDATRGYNNVWVPDLGNNGASLNSAEIKASSSGINGGQTATGKMFEITEPIYGITLAYNPNMSSADSWTYRIANGYQEEAKDINTNGSNNVPSECVVNIDEEKKLKIDAFSDRCQALDVDETLYTMPNAIPKLTSLNKGGEDRNFIKYTGTGWKFLNGKFSSAGTKKYSALMSSNSTYTLNLSESTKPNGYYIDINVGDWISYGDLGTLDAYYDTVPTSKIYDLSLDLDTDEEGMTDFDMNALLLTSDYGIKNAKITSGYTIEKQDTKYDMENKAKERGYDSGKRKYIGTVSIKGDDLETLGKAVSTGNKCVSALRSETVKYELEDKIVDLKAALLALEDEEVIYYINVWAKGDEDSQDIEGESYIRSDELVSAAKVDIPANSVKLTAVEKPPECGDAGHSFSSAESTTWKSFSGTPKNKEPWKVLGGKVVLNNPFTVLGKAGNGTKKFGMDWLDDSLEKWSAGYNGSGNSFVMPDELSVGVLIHRSMVDTETKDYSLTPPLASYMNGTEENKKYKNFCEEYDVPVDSYSGRGSNSLSNQYGWSSKGAVRTLGFSLFDALNIAKGGDFDYHTLYTTKYSCAVGDYVIEHSKDIQDDHYAIQGEYTGSDKKKVKVAVEGSYVGNNSDSSSLKPQLYTEKALGGNDIEVLYKVPTRVSFTPTYLMRSDYNVDNYEINGQEGSAKNPEGNREKVWVLGSKERTMNVHNLYSLKITGAEETKVQAPWSTDSRDKQHFKDTGKPTVKAGSAYKLSKTSVNLQVQSIVYLLDESFYSGNALAEVRAFNQKAIESHQELLDKTRDCVVNSGENGSYNFVYTSLPGGYDENFARKYNMFANKFTNVVKGLRHEYSDSQFSKVFNKTKVKSKVNYYDVGTSVSANYLNKEYDDSDYSTSDYAGTRGMDIKIDGKSYNVSPSLLNVTSNVLLDNPVDEVSKSKNEVLKEYYSQLQRATRAGKTWYKEDFEGVLQVTITSNISFQLDSDYSIIWDNLSDWQDKVGVSPYGEAKPSEEKYNGDSSVKIIKSNPNITNKIPAGEIGAGYGFLINDVELDGVDFGTTCMMLKPYLFEVRGNVYDDVSK